MTMTITPAAPMSNLHVVCCRVLPDTFAGRPHRPTRAPAEVRPAFQRRLLIRTWQYLTYLSRFDRKSTFPFVCRRFLNPGFHECDTALPPHDDHFRAAGQSLARGRSGRHNLPHAV